MSTAVILLNFGEPREPTPENVIPFLERIFSNNAPLEALKTPEAVKARSRMLAERRAPGLIKDYERIGGSPLVDQAEHQAEALQVELSTRGLDARVYLAYQFIDPDIETVVAQARDEGAHQIVGFPYYPLCGFSTNVAAINDLRDIVGRVAPDLEVEALTGWHYHPSFLAVWEEQIRTYMSEEGLSFEDPGTHLYFSAHGTPIKYLEQGSRYDRYVEEICAALAQDLGAEDYSLGYQNHTNRGIAWTEPGNEELIKEVQAERLVVVPISFLREQSETLSELDLDFREEAAEEGLETFRVPVPYDSPQLSSIVADLVTPFILGTAPHSAELARCRCGPGAYCTNGHREV
ncbi:MAG: ferrochelatase [Bacteroidota bacterium]